MAGVKWIQLSVDMFNNQKIKFIRTLPEGNNILLIWVMLLTIAGRCNSNGFIFLTESIPYTPKMLSDELGFEENIVILALKTLSKLKMIQQKQEYIEITGWEEHQNVQGLERLKEQNRKRQAKYKEKQKLLECNVTTNVTDTLPVTQSNAIDIDIEIDKDIYIKDKEQKKNLADAQTYFSDEKLNSTFIDFMNMRKSLKNGKMTERAITMMINKLNKQEVRTAIAMLEQSILNNWKDVYELKQESKQQAKKENKFNAFPQRDYSEDDFLSMEQRLLER
nr:phage replisome organizer N-terminal domain-containing protein [uncultured Lachnoclostridium sp.]